MVLSGLGFWASGLRCRAYRALWGLGLGGFRVWWNNWESLGVLWCVGGLCDNPAAEGQE